MPTKSSYRKKVYPRKRKAGKKTVKKAIAQVKKQNFNKKVLSVMRRAEETKHAQPVQNLAGTVLYGYDSAAQPAGIPAGTSSFIELTSVFNTIGQGTGQGDRVGNRISPNRFVFTGYMNYNANNVGVAQTNCLPMYVKMFIFRMKNTLSATQPDMTKFFQYGSASQAPTGYIQDIKNKVNTDDITLYATRTFKLGNSALVSTGVVASADTNNDFKQTQAFKVDLTRYVKKVIYDDTTAVIKNHQMFCAFLFGRNDCLALTKNALNDLITPIQISYDIQVSYKDD